MNTGQQHIFYMLLHCQCACIEHYYTKPTIEISLHKRTREALDSRHIPTNGTLTLPTWVQKCYTNSSCQI